MVSLYAVWVPAFAVAHLLGVLLLLYSLEQVGGYVSKAFKHMCGSGAKSSSTTEQAAEEETVPDSAEKGEKLSKGYTVSVEPATFGTASSILGTPYSAELSWKDVGCNVLDNKTMGPKRVLSGCTGTALPGETIGLLGPSGAGKTTLLDVLAGRRSGSKNVFGEVSMNGAPCGVMFRRISAYVPQDDVFVATLTAMETLKFRAALTVPSTVLKTQRRQRIQAVLETMGLWRVRDTKVGGLLPGGIEVRGLSGGEKRRLSIACALIANPSILFLDEPTTGLDSFAALNVADHLALLANMGHTVIASIHQPRPAIFERFNKVVVLSEGHQVYLGAPSQCVDWFQTHLGYPYVAARDGNVPDWIMDTVSVGFTKPEAFAARSMTTVQQVEAAAALFHSHGLGTPTEARVTPFTSPAALKAATAEQLPREAGKTADTEGAVTLAIAAANQEEAALWASGNYAASWFKQFRVLFKRALLSQLRNPTDTSSRLLMSTWVGTLAGLVFDSLPEGAASTEQRLALLFFMLLLYQLMPFCFMSFYVADRRFFQADVAADLYAPSAYYLAAVSASAPFVIINTIAGGLMAYGLTGLRYAGYAIVLYLVVLCLQALISNQLQIFCVWLTPNQDMAYVLATGYVASSILLSGFYLRIKDIRIGFIRALSWLSYTKYAMQGVGRVELAGRTWDPSTCQQTSTDPLSAGPSTNCSTTGNDLLDYYGYNLAMGTIVGALIGFYVVFHIGSYLSLSYLYRKR